MGKQLTAIQYLAHWRKYKVWTHLEWPKHRKRLEWCAINTIGENFADIGCACGHSTDIMKGYKAGKWTGVDFCQKTISIAKNLFPNIQFHALERITDLPILGEFDSVVCSEVLEHLPDDKEAIKSLVSITKKKLLMTTPTIYVNDPGHIRIYKQGELEKLLNDFNFEIIIEEPFFYITVEK